MIDNNNILRNNYLNFAELRINSTDILASQVELGLVPVKPICEAFGIASNGQIEKLKEDPLYGSTGNLRLSVAADGKDREMYCLPFEYCLGWMLGINSANVKEEIREKLLDYQRECVEVLKRHFIGNIRKLAEVNHLEIKSLERINELIETKNRINSELKDEKDKLQKIRDERLKDEPTLF